MEEKKIDEEKIKEKKFEFKKIELDKTQKIALIVVLIITIIAILFFTGFIPRFYETYFKADTTTSANHSSQNVSNNSESNSNDNKTSDTSDDTDSSDDSSDNNSEDSSNYEDNLTCSTIHITTSQNINSDTEYTPCTISISDCDSEYELTDSSAQIRLRGNSTQRNPKKPYRIKFDESTQLLGLSTGSSKNWVLLAEYNDYSMLRNTITYNFANKLSGLEFAPDCAFVNVYINDNYNGVYLLTEQVQVSNDRIDIDESGVDDPSITDTGYLLELEASSQRRNEEGSQGTDWFAVSGYAGSRSNDSFFDGFDSGHSSSYDVAYYVIKSDAKSKEQVEYIQNYMVDVYNAIYKEQDFDLIDELIDIDSAVDMFILQLLCNDYDNNFSSSYVYKDAGGKLFFGPPWDFDLSYGNYRSHSSYDGDIYIFHLLKDLGNYSWFMDMVAQRFNELNSDSDSPIQQMLSSINTYTTTLSEPFNENFSVTYNSNSFNNFDGFDNNDFEDFIDREFNDFDGFNDRGGNNRGFNGGGGNINISYNSQQEAANSLYQWLEKRIEYISKYFNRSY